MPIRRFAESAGEFEKKAMKKPPTLSKSDLLEQGIVRNFKKINRIDYVDGKEEKRLFKDGTSVYCRSLKCYVTIKSFDPATLKYIAKLNEAANDEDQEPLVINCGSCKKEMEKIRGMPPGYPGANCDKCGAQDIERNEFLYHCRHCQWDLCNDCFYKEEKKWKEKKVSNMFKFD